MSSHSLNPGLTPRNSHGSSKNTLLAGLNAAQREAVLHKNGPFLIVAGAGSGKTRVLTHRIAYLIADGVKPDQILALTFTNKAAQEMKERISQLLGHSVSKWTLSVQVRTMPWIGTFHSLGAWILRRNAKAIGLSSHFTILDEEDRLSLIKDTIKELKLDLKQFQPSRMKSLISQKKGDLISIDDFREEANDYFSRTLGEIWQKYEDKLKMAHALDFDDLLTRTLMLLRARSDILSAYQKQWEFIHIDEYQDTDHVQYILANLLAKLHSNLCVVGDVDQAIYSWRGADFRNILQFEDDWSQAKVITLEENYRSVKPILEAANAVIVKNVFRKPKNLFTKQTEGEKLELACAQNEDEEAQWIAGRAKDLLAAE
ncbi:UvrD-helicase domain-containing protein [Patescibacteria group bacterium]|nr:UvrD-helicase domain-containing protein [Patescibacteria group bacterium]